MFDKYNDVLSVNDVCTALHIGKNTIYKFLKHGVIKSIKIGNKYLVPKMFLIDFVNTYR